ncbi:hypothetical protein CTI12_AA295710 [Artemisia annua]|uniref:Extensin domain-containing protein n=1 Tax=Artemisia annua TaxID=35608 RepID=A0A2U1N845_ARTAN|nr:hypothetical protein CTI12_AA295710 [Artemisia annua]
MRNIRVLRHWPQVVYAFAFFLLATIVLADKPHGYNSPLPPSPSPPHPYMYKSPTPPAPSPSYVYKSPLAPSHTPRHPYYYISQHQLSKSKRSTAYYYKSPPPPKRH